MARQAGVDAFALSWWGSSSPENTNVAVMFDTALADDSPMRLAIHFETGGIATENLASELDAVLTAYGSHPNYLQIDGRPVVYLYNAGQHPADVWSAALSSAQVAEHDAFFFADGIGGDEYLTADMFDGLYASGPMFEYADGLLREAHEYGSSRARSVGLLYSGTVFPGYDDRIIRTPSLVVERNGGKTYEESWYEASRVKPDLIFITSWNEWHEGSEIEPSIEHGDRSLELTAACLELLAPGRAAAAGS